MPFLLATYLQFPANSTTCLGATTEFDCASTDAQTIFYYVNNTPAVSLSAQGITVSAPISNGSITLVKLYVAGTSAASVSKILCTILFTNGSFLNSTSYLTTQGTYMDGSDCAHAHDFAHIHLCEAGILPVTCMCILCACTSDYVTLAYTGNSNCNLHVLRST